MIIVCITVLLITLIVCRTIIYIKHNNIDSADVSKLEDINIICSHIITQEFKSKQPFDIRKYKNVVEQIYNITKIYNQ